MLPMNKLYEDVADFIRDRDEADEGNVVTGMDIRVQRDDVVLFAHDLSEKYEELVSVELVDTLTNAYYDSTNHRSKIRTEELHTNAETFVKTEHLKFLDAAKQTGAINMFGAKAQLQQRFKELNDFQAKCIISYWMNNFNAAGTKLKKDDVLDHIDDGIDLDGEE